MAADAPSPADDIDAIIANAGGWKGATLAELRRIILSADPAITEDIKWRKPSKPEGVATWVCEGNLCMADILKNAVRLTFPKGAKLDDPTKVFNTRLDSASVRAVDYAEADAPDTEALRAIVRGAIAVNRES
jgi:hypothetical protein